jgi:hypothetical protein
MTTRVSALYSTAVALMLALLANCVWCAPYFDITDISPLLNSNSTTCNTLYPATLINNNRTIAGSRYITNCTGSIYYGAGYTLSLGSSGSTSNFHYSPYALSDTDKVAGLNTGPYPDFSSVVYIGNSDSATLYYIPNVNLNVTALNNNDLAVGFGVDRATNARSAALFGDGQVNFPGTLAGTSYTEFLGVNDSGRVVGWSMVGAQCNPACGKAVAYRQGQWIDFSPFLGALAGTEARAEGINNFDQIIGRSFIAEQQIGWIIEDTHVTEIKPPSSALPSDNAYVLPRAINNLGVVIGSAGSHRLSETPIIYAEKQTYDLNALIDPSSEWRLKQVYDINDFGQLVGSATGSDGADHSVLLSPTADNPFPRLQDPSVLQPPADCTVTSEPSSLPVGGGTLSLSASCGRGGSPTNFAWSGAFADGQLPSGKTSTGIVTHTTTFSLVGSNPAGSSSPSNIAVTVGQASTAPIISILQPASGPAGATVEITGANFGTSQNAGAVMFGTTQAHVLSWTNTTITVIAPEGAIGTLPIVVMTSTGNSNEASFTYDKRGAPPSITSLSIYSGWPGTVVEIIGNNFGLERGVGTVSFGPNNATVLSWSGTTIRVIAPQSPAGSVVVTVTTSTGKSNELRFSFRSPRVVFLPGVEASNLYECTEGKENRIWPTISGATLTKLSTTLLAEPNGTLTTGRVASQQSIHTRDILLSYLNKEFYSPFKDFMDRQFPGWKPFPYDWRYSYDQILEEGTTIRETQDDGSDPCTGSKVRNLIHEIEQSDEPVAIVTHSNGGLLAKRLIQVLAERGTVNRIARLILIASPQFGTPQAQEVLFHGTNFPDGGLAAIDPSKVTPVVRSLPVVYALLPSQKFFETNTIQFGVSPTVVHFSDQLAKEMSLTTNQSLINAFDEFAAFALGLAPYKCSYDGPGVRLECWQKGSEALLRYMDGVHIGLDQFVAPSTVPLTQIIGTNRRTMRGYEYSYDSYGKPVGVPLWDYQGDGTVLVRSAQGNPTSGETYIVQMDQCSTKYGHNYKHATILSIPEVQNLLTRLIQGERVEENNITCAQASGASLNTGAVVDDYHVFVGSPVDLHATDLSRRHTGTIDAPVPESDARLSEEKIPNSTFRFPHELWLSTDGGPYDLTLQGKGEGGRRIYFNCREVE